MAREISQNARRAYQMLSGMGYKPHVAAGLVGNLIQESGWNINTTAVGDNGNAFGSAQWNGPRRRAYKAWASDQGLPVDGLGTQIAYLDHEMKTSERSAAQAILGAGTVRDAAVVASNKFWRPGHPALKNRMRNAEMVLAQMVGTEAPKQARKDVRVAGGIPDDVRARLVPYQLEQQPQQPAASGIPEDVRARLVPYEDDAGQDTPSVLTSATGVDEGPAPALTDSGMPAGMVELQSGHVLDTEAFAEHALTGGDLGDHVTGLAGQYLQGIPFIGEYADEVVGAIDEAAGGVPGLRKKLARAFQSKFQELYPNQSLGTQIAGGVLTTGPYIFAAAPSMVAAAPASTAGKVVAGVGAGAATGAVEGAVSGYGAGNGGDRAQSAQDRALMGAGVGAVVGAGTPLVAKGVNTVAERFIGNNASKVAKTEGVSNEAVDIAGRMIENDGGEAALRNLDAPDAMIGDAGAASAGLLDAAIQKAGPGGRIAREAIEDRAAGAADDINAALNDAFGPVGPGREVVIKGQKNPLGRLYDIAYRRPIDYASEAGREIEGLMSRVPADVIRRADNLMAMEGAESAQRLIRVVDGEEVITALPDVRQLDYITRSLNDVGKRGDGRGALGGNTNEGRVYTKLAREIRNNLREAVPEWGRAVDRAATEIGLKEARDLGETALKDTTTRSDLMESVADMSQAELRQLRRGVREFIDDKLAKVKRTAVDDNTVAREGLDALKALSSRASRQKLNTILGTKQAKALTNRIDKAARAFELRARTADNSKTFARQTMNEALKDMTDPGVIGKILEGSPVQSGRRLLQKLTNLTPEARRQVEERLAGEIATILTQKRGSAARTALLQISRSLKRDEAGRALADRLGNAAAALTVSTGGQSTRLLEGR